MALFAFVVILNLNMKDSRKIQANHLNLSISNIEALASESGSGGSSIHCYVNLKFLPGARTIECYNCKTIEHYWGTGTYHTCNR